MTAEIAATEIAAPEITVSGNREWLDQGERHDPDKDVLLEMYGRIALIRRCGDKIAATIRAGRLVSTYYSAKGQECVAAGMAQSLNSDDYLVTIYRGIHDHLAKGVPVKALWAEYAGRITGPCKGKGGPMHITHPLSGTVVTTGIVGGGIPIANGLAWASQLKGDGRITVCSFGDGASNIGAFHEGLNLASLWRLPVVFLCQNNGFAEHTRFDLGTSAPSVAARGAAYSMPAMAVNGNDPIEMLHAARIAVERARSGGGPTLIEAHTFRLEGHVFGDPSNYIPKAEFEAAKAADPVPLFRARLIDDFGIAESAIVALEDALDRDIEEAATLALAAPYPPDDEIFRDVYEQEIVSA